MAGLLAGFDGLLLPAFAAGAGAVGVELHFATRGLERDDAGGAGFAADADQVVHRATLRHALRDINRGRERIGHAGADDFDHRAVAIGRGELTFDHQAFAVEEHDRVAAAGAEAADHMGGLVGRQLDVGAGLAGRGLLVVDPDAKRAHQARATGRS